MERVTVSDTSNVQDPEGAKDMRGTGRVSNVDGQDSGPVKSLEAVETARRPSLKEIVRFASEHLSRGQTLKSGHKAQRGIGSGSGRVTVRPASIATSRKGARSGSETGDGVR
jgi:hypothetical protein